MTNTNSDILQLVKQASDGLLFPSESEYPFQVFFWEGIAPITPEKIIQKTNHLENTPIQVVTVEEFLRVVTTEEDWHEEDEKQTVKKYQFLRETLQKYLENIQVYRLGEIEIDVYILGTTKSGDCAGLSTKVIET